MLDFADQFEQLVIGQSTIAATKQSKICTIR